MFSLWRIQSQTGQFCIARVRIFGRICLLNAVTPSGRTNREESLASFRVVLISFFSWKWDAPSRDSETRGRCVPGCQPGSPKPGTRCGGQGCVAALRVHGCERPVVRRRGSGAPGRVRTGEIEPSWAGSNFHRAAGGSHRHVPSGCGAKAAPHVRVRYHQVAQPHLRIGARGAPFGAEPRRSAHAQRLPAAAPAQSSLARTSRA